MKYIPQITLEQDKIELLITDMKVDSLETLYHLTREMVFGFAFSLLKNKDDAEDVMQDTYVNIYKYAHNYVSYGKPLAWMLTITKNLSLIKLKKRSRDKLVCNEDFDLYLNSFEDEKRDNKIYLETILNILSDEERNIVILSSIKGLKHWEIAELLDIKLSTVLSKYHRAIKKIRSNYGKEMQYEKK